MRPHVGDAGRCLSEIPKGGREILCFSLSPFRIMEISGPQPRIILSLFPLQGHLAKSGDI